MTNPQPHPRLRIESVDGGAVEVTITSAAASVSARLDPDVARDAGAQLIALALAESTPRHEFIAHPEPTAADLPQPPDSAPLPKPPPPPPSPEPEPSPSAAAPVCVPPEYEPMLNGDHHKKTWHLTRKAKLQAAELDISDQEMFTAASEPDWITQMPEGAAKAHVRADVSVVVPDRDPDTIIGVRREWKRHGHQAAGAVRRGRSGGPGRRMPSSFQEFAAQLRDHGFTIEQGRNHPKVRHPDRPGVVVTIPASTSDHRGYLNAVGTLRQKFGIDITGPTGGNT